MLQFFRINDPYRIIFVFLILVLVRAGWIAVGLPLSLPELKWLLLGQRLGDGFTMYKDLYDHTGPLAALVYKWLDWVFGRSRWVHIVFSTLLVTIQAGVFNNILLKNKAYSENNYLPAFFYVVLTCSVADFFALSPQLMALTFILLSLNHIFRRIDNVVTDELFLLSGIYLGVATLFYLPAIIFFVIFLLSFILFSSAVPRRLILLVYGALTIFVVTWGYFFWFGAGLDFINDFFVAGTIKPRVYFIGYRALLGVGGFLLGTALISVTVLFTARVTNYQQKMQQVMVSFLIAGLLVLVITKDLMTADLLFFVPSATFFLVHYFLGLRRRIWKFVLPYVIIIGLVAYPWMWLQHNPLPYLLVGSSEIDVPERKVMGIGLPLSDYQDYEMAGPFMDDYISKKKLVELNYYDEASELFETLHGSKAEVIIDRWGIVPTIFDRFPQMEQAYAEKGKGIYRLK